MRNLGVHFFSLLFVILFGCGPKPTPTTTNNISPQKQRSGLEHTEPKCTQTPYGLGCPLEASKIVASITLDESTSKVRMLVDIDFKSIANSDYKAIFGFPSNAALEILTLDGASLLTDQLKTIQLPIENPTDTYHLIDASISAATHQLHFEYTLNANADLITNYNDVNGSGLETLIPCNPMLYNQFEFRGNINVVNTTQPYNLFSNAVLTNTALNNWDFHYDTQVNALAPFIHLIPQKLIYDSSTITILGKNNNINITAYRLNNRASTPSDATRQIANQISYLENTLGPYAHGTKFTAYLIEGAGGMEYSGATVSSQSALDHEVFHSWYAVGTFPRYYSDAWIDEALARWFDNGNPATPMPDNILPILLAGYDPFELFFTTAAYSYGSRLISHLAWLAGGKEVFIKYLSEFYLDNQLKTITTEQFRDFLERKMSGHNLHPFFSRYVFNQ